MVNRQKSKHRPADSPEWIFRWRHFGDDLFPKVAALLICGSAFAVFLTMVRVRVVPPMQPEGRKGYLIYLNPGPEADAWALRAKEGGPFPSRFEPSEWEGIQGVEQAAMDAVKLPFQAHALQLRDLPWHSAVAPVLLADHSERVFPSPVKKAEEGVDFTAMELTPVIYPLSNLSPNELPGTLPPMDAKIDGVLSSSAWRMLVRLRADGSVAECVTLTGDSAGGTVILEKWLQGVRFKPVEGKASLWISIGIGFVNTSVENGPLPH